ncbi:hypothetical protein [Streptomyces sp. NPDC052693]|uniref:hypothetical protein n=1 Tax=Streptomyces sp. NPDC052693 TaxID=3155814 RepID=UPI00343D669B
MPFGSGDRAQLRQVIDQLCGLATDLAAVKQQVADQQHTIDRIRQDTDAALTRGLTDMREIARDALTRTDKITTGRLTGIGSDLAAVREALTRLDNRLQAETAGPRQTPADPPGPDPEVRTTPQAAPEPEPADPAPQPISEAGDPPEPDQATLRAAAGISAATLHAHRDTWEFLVKHAGTDQHFHLPAGVQDTEGTILARVSGPSLVAALTSLHHVSHTAADPGTRAIAAHLHERLTETVRAILTRRHRGDGADPVRIVIDDRAAPDDTDDTDDGDDSER